MAYTLQSGLSPQPDIIELADFWEIECLKRNDYSASLLDVSKAIGIMNDIQEDEAEDEDFEYEEKQQLLIEEINRRITCCESTYPFKLSKNGNILSINNDIQEEWIWIYVYLLLATRNNMSSNKTAANIDGTKIFEKISKDFLVNYLGSRAKGIVFGTGVAGGFVNRLQSLEQNLKDGNLKDLSALNTNPQDDNLDIVAWIPFNDPLSSKIICFGQCKTGTHWQNSISELNVEHFLKKWFRSTPLLNPISTFMIADVLNPTEFYDRAGTNLFLDRIRLTSLFILIPDNDWYDNLKTWTHAIMSQFELSFKAA